MRTTTVGIIGLGTMGSGIAEISARKGYDVVAVEESEVSAERSRATIAASTRRAVAGGKMTEADRSSLLARISISTELECLRPAGLVIEAVPENLELKRMLLRRVCEIVDRAAILATNTSSLSVTDIAVATSRPANVVGIHFFNPAPVRAFVEVVRSVVSSSESVERALRFAISLDADPVVVDDKPGFIANALLFGYLNHAVSMFESRYATRDDIDTAMRLGCGYPMGPLQLLDLIGLDTAYEILDAMYKQSRDRLHAPRPILKHMVTAGLLGRKSGEGFYKYAEPGSSEATEVSRHDSADGPGTPRPVSSVGVVGSGTMAAGIVEVFAKAGYVVTLVARSDRALGRVRAAIDASLAKAVERGRLSEELRASATRRISGATDLGALAHVDLVVEAVVEDIAVKRELFARLDSVCREGAVLATTTSSLPVVEMASVTTRPQDVVGLHFFNPATVMKLVEVVRTVSTAPDVVITARTVCATISKHAVVCGDRAGFIVNALLFPYLNDAVRMLEANYATAGDIDSAMKAGCGYPMGPFELLDVVGLDVSLAIQQSLYREFREPGFAPSPQLEHLVLAGYLGRKTSRGFRVYS